MSKVIKSGHCQHTDPQSSLACTSPVEWRTALDDGPFRHLCDLHKHQEQTAAHKHSRRFFARRTEQAPDRQGDLFHD